MKNKKILIISIILVFILGILTFAIINNKNMVEKFSLCSIKTYLGDNIENYKENKMAFIIQDYEDGAIIRVNGEEYQENIGIYKPGKYEVEIQTGEKIEKSIIKINNIDKTKQSEYNIYMTAETLPTLFASFDMIKEKDVPSFVWYQRADTLSVDAIKNTLTNVTVSENIGKGIGSELFAKIIPEIKLYISNVMKQDPDAHFNVFVTAEYEWLELMAVEAMGLTEERVDVTMYSCGTVDYQIDYGIAAENAYDLLIKEIEDFDIAVDKVRSNQCKNDYALNFIRNEKNEIIRDYSLINSFRNNVEYYLQFPELIEFKDERVAQKMKEAHMIKIEVNLQFDKLTEEQKEIFFKLTNIDKEKFDKEYFNVENGKYLIITGTNPYYGEYTKEQFENIMNQVVEKYGKDYIIVYKPHPVATPNEEQKQYLNNLNIKVLPAKTPMEAIAFVYKDLKLGGFASSLYLSMDEGSTLFFFADKVENIVLAVSKLYDKLFSNAELMQPK